MSTSNMRALVREIANLKNQVNNMSTPGLKFASVEQGGAITVREPVLDEHGNPKLNADGIQEFRETVAMGAQWDGSYAAAPLNSGQLPPPTPTTPTVIPVPGGLVVKWDGLFTDSLFAPMNFSRIETHVDTEMNFDSSYADTIVGTTSSPRASYVVLQGLDPSMTHYAKLVCRDQAGARGPDSGEGFANPLPAGTDQETRDAIAKAIADAGAAQAAAEQASADAAGAQETADQAGVAAGAAQGAADAAQVTADEGKTLAGQALADATYAKDLADASKLAADAATAEAHAAEASAIAAKLSADTALSAANGKNKITWSDNPPPGSGILVGTDTVAVSSTEGAIGDTWFVRDGSPMGIKHQYRYVADIAESGATGASGPGWVLSKLSDAMISTLSVGKLTTGALNASTIIRVGDVVGTRPDGSWGPTAYLDIGQSSIQVFRPLGDGDAGAGEGHTHTATVTIGGAESDRLILVDPTTGDTLAGFDEYGNGMANAMSTRFLSVDGRDLGNPNWQEDVLFEFPRGFVAGFMSTTTYKGPQANSELGVMELGFELKPYRRYKIVFDGRIEATTHGSGWRLFMKYVTGDPAPAPTISNTSQLTTGFYVSGGAQYQNVLKCHLEGFMYNLGGYRDCRVLITLQRLTGGYPFMSGDGGTYLYVEDVGPCFSSADAWSDGQYTTGGGTPHSGSPIVAGTTKRSYTKEYTASWSRNWRGGSYSSPEIRQGYSSGSKLESAFGFPTQLQADLNGATVSKVEVFMHANHWYNNNGGTMYYGVHGLASYPASYPGTYETEQAVGWSTKRGGKWFTLPSAWNSHWASGRFKGLSIGGFVSSSNNAYYGRFDGVGMDRPPKIRVTYQK